MSRYIDADALKRRFQDKYVIFNDLLQTIDEQPTADVVEVVRCKDCKFFEYDHWEDTKFGHLIVAHQVCTKWAGNVGGCSTRENGYCFLGEMKENDSAK